ncbi:MAG: head GIN domain-containing protein [Sphingomicrobium sp.]|nr:DUF2807 domain-containing protein [Sphingomonadales bacterium]
MRMPLLLIAAAVLPLGACHFSASAETGPVVQRAYPVTGPFTGLAVAGRYDVKVISGQAVSVAASGHEKALDAMVVEVRNGTLTIHPIRQNGFHFGWEHHGKVEVTVTVPAIDSAEIAGSGAINVDHVAGASFKGTVAGSGDLTLPAVDAQALDLSIAGSGDIHAVGKAQSVKLNIAGSGDIDTSKLNVLDAEASIAGSGGIKGHATRNAAISIMGSGDVEINGGAKCTVSKTGSGDARCS